MVSNKDLRYRYGEGWLDRFSRQTVLLTIAGVFVLLVSGWILYAIASQEGDREKSLDRAISMADTAFQAGDYQSALKGLQEVTGEAETDTDKIELYTNMAAAAASVGDMNLAIDYIKKKHSIDPDAAERDAYLVGTYYERVGDTAKAVEQYTIALGYLKGLPQTALNDAKTASLQERINSLERN